MCLSIIGFLVMLFALSGIFTLGIMSQKIDPNETLLQHRQDVFNEQNIVDILTSNLLNPTDTHHCSYSSLWPLKSL